MQMKNKNRIWKKDARRGYLSNIRANAEKSYFPPGECENVFFSIKKINNQPILIRALFLLFCKINWCAALKNIPMTSRWSDWLEIAFFFNEQECFRGHMLLSFCFDVNKWRQFYLQNGKNVIKMNQRFDVSRGAAFTRWRHSKMIIFM